MKYLKTYENLSDVPKREDYVQLEIQSNVKDFEIFINNNIGKIAWVAQATTNTSEGYNIKIVYNLSKTPDLKLYFQYDQHYGYYRIFKFMKDENYNNSVIYGDQSAKIVSFAPTIEELKIKLQANKYNL